MTPKKEDDVI